MVSGIAGTAVWKILNVLNNKILNTNGFFGSRLRKETAFFAPVPNGIP